MSKVSPDGEPKPVFEVRREESGEYKVEYTSMSVKGGQPISGCRCICFALETNETRKVLLHVAVVSLSSFEEPGRKGPEYITHALDRLNAREALRKQLRKQDNQEYKESLNTFMKSDITHNEGGHGYRGVFPRLLQDREVVVMNTGQNLPNALRKNDECPISEFRHSSDLYGRVVKAVVHQVHKVGGILSTPFVYGKVGGIDKNKLAILKRELRAFDSDRPVPVISFGFMDKKMCKRVRTLGDLEKCLLNSDSIGCIEQNAANYLVIFHDADRSSAEQPEETQREVPSVSDLKAVFSTTSAGSTDIQRVITARFSIEEYLAGGAERDGLRAKFIYLLMGSSSCLEELDLYINSEKGATLLAIEGSGGIADKLHSLWEEIRKGLEKERKKKDGERLEEIGKRLGRNCEDIERDWERLDTHWLAKLRRKSEEEAGRIQFVGTASEKDLEDMTFLMNQVAGDEPVIKLAKKSLQPLDLQKFWYRLGWVLTAVTLLLNLSIAIVTILAGDKQLIMFTADGEIYNAFRFGMNQRDFEMLQVCLPAALSLVVSLTDSLQLDDAYMNVLQVRQLVLAQSYMYCTSTGDYASSSSREGRDIFHSKMEEFKNMLVEQALTRSSHRVCPKVTVFFQRAMRTLGWVRIIHLIEERLLRTKRQQQKYSHLKAYMDGEAYTTHRLNVCIKKFEREKKWLGIAVTGAQFFSALIGPVGSVLSTMNYTALATVPSLIISTVASMRLASQADAKIDKLSKAIARLELLRDKWDAADATHKRPGGQLLQDMVRDAEAAVESTLRRPQRAVGTAPTSTNTSKRKDGVGVPSARETDKIGKIEASNHGEYQQAATDRVGETSALRMAGIQLDVVNEVGREPTARALAITSSEVDSLNRVVGRLLDREFLHACLSLWRHQSQVDLAQKWKAAVENHYRSKLEQESNIQRLQGELERAQCEMSRLRTELATAERQRNDLQKEKVMFQQQAAEESGKAAEERRKLTEERRRLAENLAESQQLMELQVASLMEVGEMDPMTRRDAATRLGLSPMTRRAPAMTLGFPALSSPVSGFGSPGSPGSSTVLRSQGFPARHPTT